MWGPHPQLSGELARLRAKAGLTLSGLCTHWHHGSPPCRYVPSGVKLGWELSPLYDFSRTLTGDGLVREVQTSPGNQISFTTRAAPTCLAGGLYSHQSTWTTLVSCSVHSRSGLQGLPHRWPADSGPARQAYILRPVERTESERSSKCNSWYLQNTLRPLVLL